MDYPLYQWLELEIVIDLALSLLEVVFPIDFNLDPESPPPDSRQLNALILRNRV